MRPHRSPPTLFTKGWRNIMRYRKRCATFSAPQIRGPSTQSRNVSWKRQTVSSGKTPPRNRLPPCEEFCWKGSRCCKRRATASEELSHEASRLFVFRHCWTARDEAGLAAGSRGLAPRRSAAGREGFG